MTYANGSHDGQGFIGMVGINGQAVYASAISGTKQAREHFTPTVSRTVTQASVRVRRTTGSDPLTITLKQGSAVLAAGSVSAASVPQTVSGGDNGGSVWVTVTFPAVSLTAGVTYDLVLTTLSSSNYTAAAIREGTDVGFAPSLSFPDGIAQETTTGSTWTLVYASSRMQLQFYFR